MWFRFPWEQASNSLAFRLRPCPLRPVRGPAARHFLYSTLVASMWQIVNWFPSYPFPSWISRQQLETRLHSIIVRLLWLFCSLRIASFRCSLNMENFRKLLDEFKNAFSTIVYLLFLNLENMCWLESLSRINLQLDGISLEISKRMNYEHWTSMQMYITNFVNNSWKVAKQDTSSSISLLCTRKHHLLRYVCICVYTFFTFSLIKIPKHQLNNN